MEAHAWHHSNFQFIHLLSVSFWTEALVSNQNPNDNLYVVLARSDNVKIEFSMEWVHPEHQCKLLLFRAFPVLKFCC